jgi:GNAT superfamily N-acetyltransferase
MYSQSSLVFSFSFSFSYSAPESLSGLSIFLPNVFAVFEYMGRYHPSELHWHLPLIGVDPLKQGKGFGSALMQHALVQCDRDNKLAYLEASSPRSIPFYERHGFELLGTIQMETSPSIFPMLRRPR